MHFKVAKARSTYHINLGIICHFLCSGSKVESVPWLFSMAECWAQSAYDGSASIPTKRVLQDACELGISVGYMTTSFPDTAVIHNSHINRKSIGLQYALVKTK